MKKFIFLLYIHWLLDYWLAMMSVRDFPVMRSTEKFCNMSAKYFRK